jgi:hypothetical protein
MFLLLFTGVHHLENLRVVVFTEWYGISMSVVCVIKVAFLAEGIGFVVSCNITLALGSNVKLMSYSCALRTLRHFGT